MYSISSIGQDSHAFETETGAEAEAQGSKPLVLGGIVLQEQELGLRLSLRANSDGDVVLHALTNAISGITCRNVLGEVADKMCAEGITDSAEYLKVAMRDMHNMGFVPLHVSFTIECAVPRLSPYIGKMRESIASLCGLLPQSVGITATSGEGLTPFGKREGISVFCVLTVRSPLAME